METFTLEMLNGIDESLGVILQDCTQLEELDLTRYKNGKGEVCLEADYFDMGMNCRYQELLRKDYHFYPDQGDEIMDRILQKISQYGDNLLCLRIGHAFNIDSVMKVIKGCHKLQEVELSSCNCKQFRPFAAVAEEIRQEMKKERCSATLLIDTNVCYTDWDKDRMGFDAPDSWGNSADEDEEDFDNQRLSSEYEPMNFISSTTTATGTTTTTTNTTNTNSTTTTTTTTWDHCWLPGGGPHENPRYLSIPKAEK